MTLKGLFSGLLGIGAHEGWYGAWGTKHLAELERGFRSSYFSAEPSHIQVQGDWRAHRAFVVPHVI